MTAETEALWTVYATMLKLDLTRTGERFLAHKKSMTAQALKFLAQEAEAEADEVFDPDSQESDSDSESESDSD
jgi:hypothetical protein